jgi:hypothetical protein
VDGISHAQTLLSQGKMGPKIFQHFNDLLNEQNWISGRFRRKLQIQSSRFLAFSGTKPVHIDISSSCQGANFPYGVYKSESAPYLPNGFIQGQSTNEVGVCATNQLGKKKNLREKKNFFLVFKTCGNLANFTAPPPPAPGSVPIPRLGQGITEKIPGVFLILVGIFVLLN